MPKKKRLPTRKADFQEFLKLTRNALVLQEEANESFSKSDALRDRASELCDEYSKVMERIRSNLTIDLNPGECFAYRASEKRYSPILVIWGSDMGMHVQITNLLPASKIPVSSEFDRCSSDCVVVCDCEDGCKKCEEDEVYEVDCDCPLLGCTCEDED